MAKPQVSRSLDQLHHQVHACEKCARLRAWCEETATEKRAAFREWTYWGRPVAGFGDPAAWLWIVGLAPAAHGANRTGRVFTGDRSGDFLYAALHRAGIASQSTATSREDGLVLSGCYISAAVRCAPPGNKPTPGEIANCAPFLDREWELLRGKRVLLALGKIGWDACLDLAGRHGAVISSPRPKFAHAAEVLLGGNLMLLLGSYHVSQQNTFTGKLTPRMFDEILLRASRAAADPTGLGAPGSARCPARTSAHPCPVPSNTR